MNKVFKKENLKPLLVLGTICIMVALILAAINMVTGPRIKKMEEQKVYDSLREALDGEFAPLGVPAGAPDTVTGVYKVTDGDTLVGHVVTVEKQGYASTIVLTVGIKDDGTVNKVVVTSQKESHGKDINPLLNGFAGVGEDGVADVEHVSGATITSKAIKAAVEDAFKALSADAGDAEEEEEVLPRTDAEIEALAKELVGDDAQLESVAVENTTNVKRVYRVSGNKGYVVYTYTFNERYNSVDTENLIQIGINGAIKNIKKLTWSVSEAAPDWGYVPPTDEEMDQFYQGLNGKDKDTIGDVDLATGATNTTTILVDTVKEALEVAGELLKKDLPRPEAEIESLANELIGEDAELESVELGETTNVKLAYRVKGNKGYVVYTYTFNDRYGIFDTENLIYIGTNGVIKNIKKLTWSVSEAAPDWGYVPPTDEEMEQFYQGLNGKDKDTIGEVDLATGATNTTTILVDTVKEALEVAGELIKKDMPRSVEEIEALAKELVGEGAELESVELGETTNVKLAYRVKGNKGYVVYTYTFNDRYGIFDTENLIYIGTNGTIKKINKLTWSVSEAMPEWGYIPPTDEEMDQFYQELNGKDKDTIGEVDLATGATNTTTLLVTTITEALDVAGELIKKDMPRSVEEIEALAKELVGGDVQLSNITPDGTTNVKLVYRVSGNKGYVAYTYTFNDRYGIFDTENLIYIGTDGTIKKINKLTWSVSEAMPEWGYIPPTDEEMEQFYQGLIGKNQTTIGDVDLATGATNTTTLLVTTITEALDVVGEILKNDLPRPEAEIEALIKEMVGEGEVLVNITPADAALVKRLYRVEGGKGYVAYAVAISPNYGTVETETLIYINNQGKITDIEKILWKVSDPAPDWGYNPPDDQRVDKLYNDFIGKNLDTVGEVDLATGATASGTRLVECITKALMLVDTLEGSDDNGDAVSTVNNTARVVGIAVVAVMVVGIAAAIALPIITKRRKNG